MASECYVTNETHNAITINNATRKKKLGTYSTACILQNKALSNEASKRHLGSIKQVRWSVQINQTVIFVNTLHHIDVLKTLHVVVFLQYKLTSRLEKRKNLITLVLEHIVQVTRLEK